MNMDWVVLFLAIRIRFLINVMAIAKIWQALSLNYSTLQASKRIKHG